MGLLSANYQLDGYEQRNSMRLELADLGSGPFSL